MSKRRQLPCTQPASLRGMTTGKGNRNKHVFTVKVHTYESRAVTSMLQELGERRLVGRQPARPSEPDHVTIQVGGGCHSYVHRSGQQVRTEVSSWRPHGRSPPGSSVPGILQARVLGVGGHALLQGNLPHPGIELASPVSPYTAGQILYPLSHRGSPPIPN